MRPGQLAGAATFGIPARLIKGWRVYVSRWKIEATVPVSRPLGSTQTGVEDGAVRTRPNERTKGISVMFKSMSTSLILRGVLAIIVGIIALAWPGVTILALVILFAVYAFIDAGLQAMRAFSSATAGPVFGHLLLGLIDLAAGVIALAWPRPTPLVPPPSPPSRAPPARSP